jgi:hypothetical protein
MTRHRRGWTVVGVLSVTAALLLACSSDDDGSSSTTTAPDGATSTSTSTTDGSTTGGADGGPTDGTGEPGATDTPSVDLNALPPVAVGEAADFGDGLLATVTDVEPIELEAQAPGETGGPGVIVTIELQNDTAGPVDLGAVSINASYADGTPAVPHQTGPADVFTGTLAPGANSTGSYLFRVPTEQQGSIVIDVHHAEEVNYVIVDVREPAP